MSPNRNTLNTPSLPGLRLPNRAELQEEVSRLRLKKRFSQNFLVDDRVLDAIVQAAEPATTDTVLEVGAGGGFLTQRLLPVVGALTAVELEWTMIDYLQKKFSPPEQYPHLTLVEADILKFPMETAIAAEQFKVVGNLPYAITSPILFRLVGELSAADHPLRQRLSRVVLMVQQEVAERIVATPGQKAYGPLAIASQFWFEAKLAFRVPASAFVPRPKVVSAVVTLTPRQAPRVAVPDLSLLSRLVRVAFAHKRKTLWNNLRHANWLTDDEWQTILTLTAIDRNRRPGDLAIEEFGALCHAIHSGTG
ncbi:MAG: 16S rRNA (adenine(1518)-N(6)/adenine(1519)-N(6))-dimethyltransferase RsmA [Candidatus Melainabacteria bacterium]|nr:16S rRNA (adenine(1518)-N(6)/adenine(1519)-N(6))-dimethyltransferase RsmA [Candidatus Melainabacteria bacterium]